MPALRRSAEGRRCCRWSGGGADVLEAACLSWRRCEDCEGCEGCERCSGRSVVQATGLGVSTGIHWRTSHVTRLQTRATVALVRRNGVLGAPELSSCSAKKQTRQQTQRQDWLSRGLVRLLCEGRLQTTACLESGPSCCDYDAAVALRSDVSGLEPLASCRLIGDAQCRCGLPTLQCLPVAPSLPGRLREG